jgi:penicillin amidase
MLFLTISVIVTIALIVILDSKKVLPAPLGKLLSPQEGLWQNAEPKDIDFGGNLKFPDLKGKGDVYFDERLVPHIFAKDDNDAYFIQGYLHARFRLWQMEFQTYAAAGRVSEIVGEKGLNYDRTMRRMGMVYGAERALAMMEEDVTTKASMDAYTAGVNAYIATVNSSNLPVEYKLLGYTPEKWTNLKSALFYKAMTNDLAGFDTDFEFTNALRLLGEEKFKILYPDVQDSLSPIIPKGTQFYSNTTIPVAPSNADSVYFHRKDSIWYTQQFKPNPSNGSNNWALSGSKTKSGKPILCNDPHLSITLPSIWYEMQINTPNFNVYGVSFPGILGVMIGFNDNIAFGFTNAGRDMKDYYEITFRDKSRLSYWFNNQWKNSNIRIEHIAIKDQKEVLDTVAYSVFGPVMYDESFPDKLKTKKAYALRWIAHDPSNALKMWYLLNRAKTYNDYLEAIKYFNAPAQNMLFASKDGDIALWQQGTFPLRWQDQGKFVMPGSDSSYMWQGFIPQQDNPHIINPIQGYISSANQRPVDSTYPYFIPGRYDMYRGISINRRLSSITAATPDDMKKLQNDTYNVLAETAVPILLKNVNQLLLNADERKYVKILSNWNFYSDINEKGPTIFTHWLDSLRQYVFQDDLIKNDLPISLPVRYTLVENLLKDSAFSFIDNSNTAKVETLSDAVTISLKKCTKQLVQLEKENKLTWGNYKNTTLYHLLRTATMPFAKEHLPVGGGENIINATTHDHGPSWKMIVQLTTPTEAYGVFPGGQSGNPGSKYYDNFASTWAAGKYYKLWMMQPSEVKDKRIQSTLHFSK